MNSRAWKRSTRRSTLAPWTIDQPIDPHGSEVDRLVNLFQAICRVNLQAQFLAWVEFWTNIYLILQSRTPQKKWNWLFQMGEIKDSNFFKMSFQPFQFHIFSKELELTIPNAIQTVSIYIETAISIHISLR